jgi:5-methylcytosine-specific restriction endonuclease McrA
MTAYEEKLKDPRWQKRRLEIFSRDNWACTKCKNKISTLQVHHTEYIQGRAPWDYPGHYLITLCELCHLRVSDKMEVLPELRYEKGRDPRWQKIRLETMELAKFTCKNCGSDNKPLEIHHPYRIKGLALWEYPPYCLEILCCECHTNHHELCRYSLNHGVQRHPYYALFWEKLARDNPGWGVDKLAGETRRLTTLRLQQCELPFWVLPDQWLPY